MLLCGVCVQRSREMGGNLRYRFFFSSLVRAGRAWCFRLFLPDFRFLLLFLVVLAILNTPFGYTCVFFFACFSNPTTLFLVHVHLTTLDCFVSVFRFLFVVASASFQIPSLAAQPKPCYILYIHMFLILGHFQHTHCFPDFQQTLY